MQWLGCLLWCHSQWSFVNIPRTFTLFIASILLFSLHVLCPDFAKNSCRFFCLFACFSSCFLSSYICWYLSSISCYPSCCGLLPELLKKLCDGMNCSTFVYFSCSWWTRDDMHRLPILKFFKEVKLPRYIACILLTALIWFSITYTHSLQKGNCVIPKLKLCSIDPEYCMLFFLLSLVMWLRINADTTVSSKAWDLKCTARKECKKCKNKKIYLKSFVPKWNVQHVGIMSSPWNKYSFIRGLLWLK